MIFVFGSNTAGVHGAGAAKYAHQFYGAGWGIGEGCIGQSYAIPTKDHNIRTRSWDDICDSIRTFLKFVTDNPDLQFQLTPIGCGLAGGDVRRLWKFLQMQGVPDNVFFTAHWANDHMLSN